VTTPKAPGLPILSAVLSAAGIGRPGETHPRRPHLKYLVPAGCAVLKSVHLNPWSSKFRLGWALGWDGLYWHRAIGIKGADWNERSHPYYGPPPGWHEFGPFAYLRWGRRGNLKSDRRFCRAMACTCPRRGLIWPIGYTHSSGCPIATASG
jgi:hypothetical protein